MQIRKIILYKFIEGQTVCSLYNYLYTRCPDFFQDVIGSIAKSYIIIEKRYEQYITTRYNVWIDQEFTSIYNSWKLSNDNIKLYCKLCIYGKLKMQKCTQCKWHANKLNN